MGVCVILHCSYAPTHKFCLGPPMNVGGHHPTYSYDIMLRAARKSWNRDHHVYCDFVSWPWSFSDANLALQLMVAFSARACRIRLVYNLTWILSEFFRCLTGISDFRGIFDPLWIEWAWHDLFCTTLTINNYECCTPWFYIFPSLLWFCWNLQWFSCSPHYAVSTLEQFLLSWPCAL